MRDAIINFMQTRNVFSKRQHGYMSERSNTLQLCVAGLGCLGTEDRLRRNSPLHMFVFHESVRQSPI